MRKRLDLEPLGDQGGVVIQLLEDLRIGRVSDGRAGPPRRLSFLDGALRLAAAVALNKCLAVAANLGDQALAQGVDDAGADAVQSAGHLVGVVIKLAAGVERGEDHFERALAGLGMAVDRDAAAVIGHRHRLAVGVQRHDDPRGVPVHHLVDGVVDDFPEQVVKARLVDAADVHARPAPNGLQALEHRDRFCRVASSRHGRFRDRSILSSIRVHDERDADCVPHDADRSS